MGIDKNACPVCGQPVATVVRRHKTLGAWVPVWGPGPCRNHKCAAYVDVAVEAAESAAEKPRAVARRTHGTHGTHAGPGGHDGQGVRVAEAEPPGERAAEGTTEVSAEVTTEKTEEKA